MAAVARQWTREVFAHLGRDIPALVWAEPGQPGNLYDAFSYQDWSFDLMNEVLRADEARWWLRQQLGHVGPASVVLREHHAYPSFDEHGHPQNEEARIIDEVIADLLDDQNIVTRILNIHRGWYGLAVKEERKILVRMFREDDAEDLVTANQWNLYDIFQSIIHEIQHLLEDPEYADYTNSFPGERARNTLGEGFLSVLTETVWAHGEPGLADIRVVVEGELASEDPLADDDMPDPADTQRYRSHAEAEDLIRLVGILNVLAAFLAGDVEKIAGPERGSPAACWLRPAARGG